MVLTQMGPYFSDAIVYHLDDIQYTPRNMHTVFALRCFVVVIYWLIFPYPSGLLHWHCGNLTIAPVPAKQPWWIWINTSYEFIRNDCITTTKQSTTKQCAYFLGYTLLQWHWFHWFPHVIYCLFSLWEEATRHEWIPHTKGQQHGPLTLLLGCWTNIVIAGDLRRHRPEVASLSYHWQKRWMIFVIYE